MTSVSLLLYDLNNGLPQEYCIPSSYLLSKFDYALMVWTPYYIRYHSITELLKYITFILTGIYLLILATRRSAHFNLLCLTDRKEIDDAGFISKLVHRQTDALSLLSKLDFHVPHTKSTATTTCEETILSRTAPHTERATMLITN